MIANPYKAHLDDFFSVILSYRHTTLKLKNVLENDLKSHLKENTDYFSVSNLIISDWSSSNDNGWEINFPTGIRKETIKDSYTNEVEELLSREYCLIFSQTYEALERFLKDVLFIKASQNEELKEFILEKFLKRSQKSFTRENMPGGDNLFKVLKKACNETFNNHSIKNNLNFSFYDIWKVLSESRHAITHSRSFIKRKKISETNKLSEIFNYLFTYSDINNDPFLIRIDFSKFEGILKFIAEFGFQMYKSLSVKDGFEWKFENYNNL